MSTSSHANPLLRCYVSYAGSVQTIESQIVQDPYDVKTIDIAERFTFKAVMVGKAQQIDYIKLYAYFQTRRSDIPVHQATYRPPFKVTAKESPLTPQISVYAGDVERELQYRCTLQEVQQ
ncbi:MAG: hypothetical protein HYR68_12265 [Burkholderiales bacterium]|nr:hypothetical protein [Burkholderiales bacterium]MBI3728006.1 hypothetical protein [Burkholderiales bacterium]